MDIKVCNNYHNIDTISRGDFIIGEAMLNRQTTVGVVVDTNALYFAIPKDVELDLVNFNTLFEGADKIKTVDDLVNYFNKLKESTITYPFDRMDDFLTYYVNDYLERLLCTTFKIDSVFTDFEELVQIPEIRNAPGLDKLIKFFTTIFTANYSSRNELVEIVKDYMREANDNNTLIYTIPVLTVNPVCGLIGFGNDGHGNSINGFRKFLCSDDRSKIICQNDSFYPNLEDIYAASQFFRSLGYIYIYAHGNDSIKFGRKKVKVYKRDNGTYFITK